MKLSEMTVNDLKNYLHVYHADDDILIQNILSASKAFVYSYTGLSAEKVDECEDLPLVVYILASEMYDNRTYVIEVTKIQTNPVIDTILSMHSVNLL